MVMKVKTRNVKKMIWMGEMDLLQFRKVDFTPVMPHGYLRPCHCDRSADSQRNSKTKETWFRFGVLFPIQMWTTWTKTLLENGPVPKTYTWAALKLPMTKYVFIPSSHVTTQPLHIAEYRRMV